MKKTLTLILLVLTISSFAQEIKFGKVSKEELQEKFYPLDSTSEAAYLFRKRRTYYVFIENKGQFNVVTEIHNRIKIYNRKGFDIATVRINYYTPENRSKEKVTSLKAVTFNIDDGEVIETKLSNKDVYIEKKDKFWSVKKVSMSNIKEGSIVDIKYKITSPYFGKINDLELQFDVPVKKLDYSIEVPEFLIFNKIIKGHFSITPKFDNKNGMLTILFTKKNGFWVAPNYINRMLDFTINITRFIAKDIPALKDNEPFVTNIDNYRGGVKFEFTHFNSTKYGGGVKSFSTNWSIVSKQVFKSNSFGAELDKVKYFKDDLQIILSRSKTDSDKLSAIFQFVKDKVKWNGFKGIYTDKGVKKAFKERIGSVAEINLMLTSMFRSAGLNANPVLVSTRRNGIPLFPTIEGFNYVISMVEFKDGTYFLLDATEPYSLPNILPLRTLNWNGRKVTKEGNSSWVKLTSSKYALEENKCIIKISENLVAEGIMITKYDNLKALNYRENNNHIKEENLITGLEEKYEFEIKDFKLQYKNVLEKPIIRNAKFISEDLIEDINGKLYVEPLLFLSEDKNPFKIEDRKYPVDFGTPWKDKNIVSIQIPEGYKVEKLPESVAIGLPDNLGVFKYQVTQSGNKISTMSILQFNEAVISSTHYAALKDFYGQVVKKQSEKIVLVKE